MNSPQLNCHTLFILCDMWKNPEEYSYENIDELFSEEEIVNIFDKAININDVIANHSIIIENNYVDEKITLLQLKAIYEESDPQSDYEKLKLIKKIVEDTHSSKESLMETIQKELIALSRLRPSNYYYFGTNENFTCYIPIKISEKTGEEVVFSYKHKFDFVQKFISEFILADKSEMNMEGFDYINSFTSDTENDDYKQYVFLQDFERFARDNSEHLVNDTLDKMVSILEKLKMKR